MELSGLVVPYKSWPPIAYSNVNNQRASVLSGASREPAQKAAMFRRGGPTGSHARLRLGGVAVQKTQELFEAKPGQISMGPQARNHGASGRL